MELRINQVYLWSIENIAMMEERKKEDEGSLKFKTLLYPSEPRG